MFRGIAAYDMLQLGHVLSNMVRGVGHVRPPPALPASIGPCPFKHGKTAKYNDDVGQWIALQLGHVLSNMVRN